LIVSINFSSLFNLLQLKALLLTIFYLDLIFYHVHYLFHHKSLYARIHKFHHTWKAPVGVSATYAHPLEHLGCNLLSVVGAPYLANLHPFWFLVWVGSSILITVSVHSGYKYLVAESHDDHHKYFRYNYGPIGFFDWLYGTRWRHIN